MTASEQTDHPEDEAILDVVSALDGDNAVGDVLVDDGPPA